jgi:hypothetical protein
MRNKSDVINTSLEIIGQLNDWLISKNYKYYTLNYTPYSKSISSLSSKIKSIGILWRQFFRISPINFRKLLGLSSAIVDPQATIILAGAYLELLKFDPLNLSYRKSFDICVDRIITLNSAKTDYFAIRQNKKMQLKYYKTSDNDIAPILTVWAGNFFLDAYDVFNDIKYLRLAKKIKNYFVCEHPREEIDNAIYFYYSPSANFKIWNASSEISAYLIKCGKLFNDSISLELGINGIKHIVKQQNKDGSWFYGDNKITKYIDNFHTAFVLRSLSTACKYIDDEQIINSLKNGLHFYKNEFFLSLNKKNQTYPKHWIKKYVPINSNIIQKVDIRDCALSIILFSEIGGSDNIEMAAKILDWTNDNMMKEQTYFAEKTWLWTNKIPYIDFQAWMLLANAKLLNSNKSTFK